MERTLGELKLSLKKTMTLEYRIPNPDFVDKRGNMFELKCDLNNSGYPNSPQHLNGVIPVKLVPVKDGKELTIDVEIPDVKIFGLEKIVCRNSESTALIKDVHYPARYVVFKMPKHFPNIDSSVDSNKKYLGTLVGRAMVVTEIETGRTVVKKNIYYDCGFVRHSKILFEKDTAFFLHVNATDEDGFSFDMETYLETADLSSGKVKSEKILKEREFQFMDFPLILKNKLIFPIGRDEITDPLYIRGMCVVDLNSLEVKIDNSLFDKLGGPYVLICGVKNHSNACYFLKHGADYVVLRVDGSGSTEVYGHFKGEILYSGKNIFGRNIEPVEIRNVSLQDNIVSGVLNDKQDKINVAFGYDVQKKEASFFKIPASGTQVTVDKAESICEFFSSRFGEKCFSLSSDKRLKE